MINLGYVALALLLRAVAERQRWQAEYTAAQLATGAAPPGNCSATDDQAA
ncbi:MAG TPA: hypothetical protein VHY21_23700 [Pseudonocardiaceae bacterium]|jgi:hypothetical protein|nr:hypothetical protein [Pseudonocardiaceae bacterium]